MERCTRCHRILKRVFFIGGAPYGIICAKKVKPDFEPEAEKHKRERKDVADTQPMFPSFSLTPEELNQRTNWIYNGIIHANGGRWIYRQQSDAEFTSPALSARLDLVNHSPSGLNWGYGGSGAAQSALAILADFLSDDKRALQLYQAFKWAFIAKFDGEKGWQLTGAQIQQFVEEEEAKNAAN